MGRIGRILVRFCLWWAGLFGWIGMGNCPCCGQPACPHGLAGSGLLAALATLFMFLLPGRQRKHQHAASSHTEEEETAESVPVPLVTDREQEHRHRQTSA